MTIDRRLLLHMLAGSAIAPRIGLARRRDDARSLVLGVIEYGQSNSEAQANSAPALLRTDYPEPTRLLMPRTRAANVWLGQTTTAGKSIRLADGAIDGLMPLRGAMGSPTHGSTSGESMVLRLIESERAAGRIDEAAIVLFNLAEGGQRIRNLSNDPETGFFAFHNLRETVIAVDRTVRAAGRRYVVRVLLTAQGESDATDAELGRKQDAVRGQIERAVRAVTGQSEPVWMLSVQPSSFFGDGAGARAILAQHDETLSARGGFFCLGPTYGFPFAKDLLHHSTIGHDMRGELYAVAYRSLVRTGRWDVLRATNAVVVGERLIRVRLSEAATFDAGGSVAHLHNHGVGLAGGEIASVRVAGRNLLITTRTPAASVTAVRLGLDGHRPEGRAPDTIPRTTIRSAAVYGRYRGGDPIVKWLCHQSVPITV